MNKIKAIYDFTTHRKVKKEVEEQTDKGKLIKTVEENEPIKIIFKNPSRQEREEADTVYAVEYGRCVRAGVLTAPLIEKLYDERDKSGILSDNFAAKYLNLYERFFEIQNQYTKLELKDKKTAADNKEINKLGGEFATIRNDLQNLESSRNSLFQNTAETKAQNKTILWLTLFLTYIEEPESTPQPFFEGETFEEKLAKHDEMIDSENEFEANIIDKMAFFVALWFMRKAATREDFTQIEKDLNPEEKEEEKQKASTEEKPSVKSKKDEEPKETVQA